MNNRRTDSDALQRQFIDASASLDVNLKRLQLSQETAALAEHILQNRIAEEQLFSAKVDGAIKEIRHNNWIIFGVSFGIISAVLTILGFSAHFLIKAVVTEKFVSESVQERLQAFSQSKIEGLISNANAKVTADLAESARTLEEQKNTLHLWQLRNRALSGDKQSFTELQILAKEFDDAKLILDEVVATFSRQFVCFRFHDINMHSNPSSINALRSVVSEQRQSLGELIAGYSSLDLSEDELIIRIETAREITDETVNCAKNLAFTDCKGKTHLPLYIDAASRADNLMHVRALIDCACKEDPNCPRTIEIEKVKAWLQKRDKEAL